MKKYLLLALLLGLPLSASADTLRCGSKLVSSDDSSFEVEQKCGKPVSRQQLGYREVTVFAYGYPAGFREVMVEEWIYGPRNGMYYYLRFEGNRLVSVESRRSP